MPFPKIVSHKIQFRLISRMAKSGLVRQKQNRAMVKGAGSNFLNISPKW